MSNLDKLEELKSVFTIAKKVGWKLVPIGHTSKAQDIPCARLIGLVLVV